MLHMVHSIAFALLIFTVSDFTPAFGAGRELRSLSAGTEIIYSNTDGLLIPSHSTRVLLPILTINGTRQDFDIMAIFQNTPPAPFCYINLESSLADRIIPPGSRMVVSGVKKVGLSVETSECETCYPRKISFGVMHRFTTLAMNLKESRVPVDLTCFNFTKKFPNTDDLKSFFDEIILPEPGVFD
ncbi:MAG: hypothetical protein NTV34_13360 [Proteobacteria bacterium]|nr:hypothetical protein [Pseudomonadota bacterium]